VHIHQILPRNPRLILPIILHWAGVSLADIGNVNVDIIMLTLGNFSNKLMTKVITKKVICYLPTAFSIVLSILL